MDYWSGYKKVQIPKLGFGTWQLKDDDCVSAVSKALEVGYRHIDTAQIYGNEEAVGQAIEKSQIPREELFITTKVWKDSLDFRDILVSVSKSLEDLKQEYVDLLLIHWPNPSFNLEEIFSALKELVDTKKVKHLGVSNFPLALMKKAQKIYPQLLCNQVEYHPFLNQNKILKEVHKLKMCLTAYSPLARGQVKGHSTLKTIAQKYKKTNEQVTLRWLIEQTDVIAIPKAKQEKHIEKNFDIFDFKLDEDDHKKIKNLASQNKRLINPEWAPKWDS